MRRFIGLFILTAVVVLLGHPGFVVPPFALTPLLLVLLPVISFYATVAPPEPLPCKSESRNPEDCPQRRQYPLQL